jgi:preprotein translocase subunit SecD
MRVLLIVLGVIGGSLLLAVGASFVLWAGADLLPRRPQPLAELTIKLDNSAVPAIATRSLFPGVRDGLREPRIGFASIGPSGDNIEVTLADGVDRVQAFARLQELSRQAAGPSGPATEKFTIAETNGNVLRLTPTAAVISEAAGQADDQTVAVLGHRLDGLSVRATVRRDGSDAVLVDLPRRANTDQLKALLVAPGKLSIRFIDTSVSVDNARHSGVPPQSELLSGPDGTPYLVQKRIAISGEMLVDAQPGFAQGTRDPIVSFRFNDAGARQLARVTTESVGLPMAIVLDGVVLAAPVIREPITGGSGQISGGFTVERANDLAITLRSGALPVPLTVTAEHDVER